MLAWNGIGWICHVVPLNNDAIMALEEQIGKHPKDCFTYLDQPIRRSHCNTAWYKALEEIGLEDFRFHDFETHLGFLAPSGRYKLR